MVDQRLDDEARAYLDSLASGERGLYRILGRALLSALAVTALVGLVASPGLAILAIIFAVSFLLSGRLIVAIKQRGESLGHIAVEPEKPRASTLTAADAVVGGRTTVALAVTSADGSDGQPFFLALRATDRSIGSSKESHARFTVHESIWTTVHPLSGPATIELPVPDDEGYSYDGPHLRRRWEVVAASVPGREHTIFARTPVSVIPPLTRVGPGRHPPSNIVGESDLLELAVRPGRAGAGGRVELSVTVLAAVQDSRTATARLLRCERVHNVPYEVEEHAAEVLHRGPIAAGHHCAWQVRTPADAPPSMSVADGEDGVQWRLEVRIDRPGRDHVRAIDMWIDPPGAIDRGSSP